MRLAYAIGMLIEEHSPPQIEGKSPPPVLVARTERRPNAPFKLPWVAKFTQYAADRFCEEIANGRIIDRICAEETWCPGLSTIAKWRRDYPDFEANYQMACRIRADVMVHQIVALADDSLDHEKTKLQISSRQWLASKLHKGAYGDIKQIETTATVNVNATRTLDVSNLTLAEIRQMEGLLMKTIEGELTSEPDRPEDDDMQAAGLAGGSLGGQ